MPTTVCVLICFWQPKNVVMNHLKFDSYIFVPENSVGFDNFHIALMILAYAYKSV